MSMREKVRAARARQTPYGGMEPDPLDRFGSFAYEGEAVRKLSALREMVQEALLGGYCHRMPTRGGVFRFVIEGQRTCINPTLMHYVAAQFPEAFPFGCRRYLVDALWRCRKCGPCLRARSFMWSKRAEVEVASSAVTWHGNVTLDPFQHAQLDAGVARRNRELGTMPEWSCRTLFQKRCAVFSEWLTDWLKLVRLREERRREAWMRASRFVYPEIDRAGRRFMKKAPFITLRPQVSYLLVAEEHNGPKTSEFLRGRPHWHILLHEKYAEELVHSDEYYWAAKRGEFRIDDAHFVKQLWKRGHTQFKMVVDARQAIYVCKYLSEDMLWRVRASQGYGDSDKGTLTCQGSRSLGRYVSAAEEGVHGVGTNPNPAAQQVRAAAA